MKEKITDFFGSRIGIIITNQFLFAVVKNSFNQCFVMYKKQNPTSLFCHA